MVRTATTASVAVAVIGCALIDRVARYRVGYPRMGFGRWDPTDDNACFARPDVTFHVISLPVMHAVG